MSKKYDVTTRTIYEPKPAEWLQFLSFPIPDPGLLQVLDSNVSFFCPEIDRAIRVGGAEPYIVNTEVPLGPRPGSAGAGFLV